MAALLVTVSLVIGIVSLVALTRVLNDRLDDQLTAAANRSAGAFGRPGTGSDEGRPGPAFLLAPGQGEGTLGALLAGRRVVAAAVLDDTGRPNQLPSDASAELLGLPTGKPQTIDLGSLGDYRVLATPRPSGAVLVTGLPLSGVHATIRQLTAVIALVTVIGLIGAVTVGTWIVRTALLPLDRVAATATRVADLPLDRGEVALAERVSPADADPTSEVGQVGAALNHLLENVDTALAARHASETRVRRFVADASHELRTPLASIRGYAELTRSSAEPIPEEVSHALDRVESEAVRMTGLVDDMLLLARLDSGRPVDRSPVDLTRMVVDATSDARAAGPGHDWDLDLPPDPVTVLGDGPRLHQVVVNLLSNARSHTPDGTTVTASLRRTADRMVELVVSDDGPGISAEQLPTVFERFTRGDASRARATGSTGLGLAIVAAVVEAHGGVVDVESQPGRTAFSVVLPSVVEERPA
jgi:two-component system OmpR family sensor kinase